MNPPNSSVYTATKAAVDSITGVLAKELGPRKIRVELHQPRHDRNRRSHPAGFIESDFRKWVETHSPSAAATASRATSPPLAVYLATPAPGHHRRNHPRHRRSLLLFKSAGEEATFFTVEKGHARLTARLRRFPFPRRAPVQRDSAPSLLPVLQSFACAARCGIFAVRRPSATAKWRKLLSRLLAEKHDVTVPAAVPPTTPPHAALRSTNPSIPASRADLIWRKPPTTLVRRCEKHASITLAMFPGCSARAASLLRRYPRLTDPPQRDRRRVPVALSNGKLLPGNIRDLYPDIRRRSIVQPGLPARIWKLCIAGPPPRHPRGRPRRLIRASAFVKGASPSAVSGRR
jgi:hypothetical protein